jgi:hypothetical protein
VLDQESVSNFKDFVRLHDLGSIFECEFVCGCHRPAQPTSPDGGDSSPTLGDLERKLRASGTCASIESSN